MQERLRPAKGQDRQCDLLMVEYGPGAQSETLL